MWHDHLLAISGASSITRTRGRALESGQMRTLEPSWVEHRCEVRLGLLLNGSSVMMGPVGRWARHIVHLMADGQFSYVQYSQLHFGWKSVILARTELQNVPVPPTLRWLTPDQRPLSLPGCSEKRTHKNWSIICVFTINVTFKQKIKMLNANSWSTRKIKITKCTKNSDSITYSHFW